MDKEKTYVTSANKAFLIGACNALSVGFRQVYLGAESVLVGDRLALRTLPGEFDWTGLYGGSTDLTGFISDVEVRVNPRLPHLKDD